jgi:ABC-type transporter Mla MlaB component
MADGDRFRLRLDDEGRLHVEGELTRHTAMEALRQFDRLASALERWEIDCSACDPVDSAAVAWLIELRKKARVSGRPLRFESLPPAVHSIARMSQVEELLAPVT